MPTLKQCVGQFVIQVFPVNRRTFDVLRFEIGCMVQRARNGISPRYHARLHALRWRKGLSLNVGSGGRGREGWINVDARLHADTYIAYDIRRPLPFATGQVKRIFAEHVIEHIDFRYDVPGTFREFYRVLEPGGVVRVIVPDASRFILAYLNNEPHRFAELGWPELPSDIYTPMHMVNHIFHQGGEHFFGWDYETMAFALKRAGFSNVRRQAFRQSIDPELAIDQEHHAPYSLYVDAIK